MEPQYTQFHFNLNFVHLRSARYNNNFSSIKSNGILLLFLTVRRPIRTRFVFRLRFMKINLNDVKSNTLHRTITIQYTPNERTNKRKFGVAIQPALIIIR